MKIIQSWKRNNPTPNGYGLTVTYVYSSPNPHDIDEIEKKLPKGMLVMNADPHETSDTRKARIFQCAQCGYGFDGIFLIDERNYPIDPVYCPNCGRRVKRDA